MKKNTLLVSVLVGVGSLAATIGWVNNRPVDGIYTPGNADQVVATEANDEYFSAMRRNMTTGEVEPGDYLRAVGEIGAQRKTSSTLGLSWSFTGPDNIGGRARDLVIDNANSDLLYSGGAGGGLYMSTNGGGTWTYKSDNWHNIHISSIAQDADGRLYAGTGFYADAGSAIGFNAFPGGGMWTSSDRGATWTHLASTMPTTDHNPGSEWAYINRIAVGKTKNSNGTYTVYAATNKGLRVSVDNGQTWYNPHKAAPQCTAEFTSNCQEVVTTQNGRVYISYSGTLYVSDDGDADCSYNLVTSGISGSNRMSITVCANDENVVYAFQSYNNQTFQILKSTDGGDNWGPMVPAPPTPVIDSTFDLLATNPVSYNQAISVDPYDCDRIYVGAVSLYRVDGAWTSVSTLFEVPGLYVHADVHKFVFDENNQGRMYVLTDGGVGKTESAGSSNVLWTTNNRYFGTTQYYGIAMSRYGHIFGGTQDNGTHMINPVNPGPAAFEGFEVWGNDGVDCEVSNIGDLIFATSQYGMIARGSFSAGAEVATPITPMDRDGSPFHTTIRLWESTNDLTSKDSLVFFNDSARFSIGNGDGNKTFFSGTLTRLQPAANIVPGGVQFVDIAGGQSAYDSSGVIKSFGDSIGAIDYVTGDYSLRWLIAPPIGSSVNSVYALTYDAGDTLELVSQNQEYPFTYVLPGNVSVGDSLTIQDPVQCLIAASAAGGINVTRQGIYEPLVVPIWENIANAPITCLEWSQDGDILFAGARNGTITRISGFNEWYHGIDPDSVLTSTQIFSGNAAVGGMCLHPTDPEKMLVTLGGYGSGTADHVYEITNAVSATGNASRRSLQGDLPDFPVYDAEYNVNNTDQVLVGTEIGLWATENINTAPITWGQESGSMGNVPVLDVRQQWLPFNEASNYGQFYLGTFGRGIWTSTDLVSNGDDQFDDFNNDIEIGNIGLYPNPAITSTRATFDVSVSGLAEIRVYDISGKVVHQEVRSFDQGSASYEFSVENFKSGTYFLNVTMGGATSHAKFVVMK